MKHKLLFSMILLLLALLSAACAGQEADNEPGAATANPTVSMSDSTATESVGETAVTPTGSVEDATPSPATGETATTPDGTAEASTPADGTGGTAIIPQTGPGDAGIPDDLDEVVRVLRETGATVEFGDEVEQDNLSVTGQSILINGEEIQVFTYNSAEEVETQASQLENTGDPEDEPQFYKLGTMLVRYVGSDPGVRDLLEDVLGANAAGQ